MPLLEFQTDTKERPSLHLWGKPPPTCMALIPQNPTLEEVSWSHLFLGVRYQKTLQTSL